MSTATVTPADTAAGTSRVDHRLYAQFNTTTAQFVHAQTWRPVAEVLRYNRPGLGVEVLMEDGQVRTVDHARLTVATSQPALVGIR